MKIVEGQNYTIPDEKLKSFLHVLVNVYFEKWKRRSVNMTEQEWDQAVEELKRIWSQGEQYPIVGVLCMAFLDELEARARGGIYNIQEGR